MRKVVQAILVFMVVVSALVLATLARAGTDDVMLSSSCTGKPHRVDCAPTTVSGTRKRAYV